jgi:CheY-like chemotaxis protein
VFGDEKLLQRILHEIFDNAIKFTSTGSIALMAEALPHHSNKRFITVRFDIIDTGIGFDTDFQERIFKMFELADDSSTRHQGGAGIGLSLCKKFCHLLEGDIQCESHLGKGTVFCITLPFSLPVSTISNTTINNTAMSENVLTQATPAPLIQEPINFLRDGYNILIAEDDEAIQMIVCALLEKMGSNSHRAFNNGKLLLDHYCVHHATTSLLLLDWNMPIMNARQTLQAVRAFEAEHHLAAVPVAVMSAHDAHSELQIQGEPELPILFKPITVNSLKKLLNIA